MDELSTAEEAEFYSWVDSVEEIDPGNAAQALKEVKQIFDHFGVTIFLRQGTCLGAIRDNGFLPWDDDVDVGSVMGIHGFTEESIDEIVATFRSNGFLTKAISLGPNPYIPLIKYSTRCDWMCFRVFGDYIVQFPFLKAPLRLFINLKEITFLDDKFYVPNPPEEYLCLKYGDDWQTPKKPGDFEEDVLDQVARMPAPKKIGSLRQLFARYAPWCRTSTIKVLDHDGNPVNGADVTAVGLGCFRTDRRGCVTLYTPREEFYPIVIKYGRHEVTDYLQKIIPGKDYVYRLDEP